MYCVSACLWPAFGRPPVMCSTSAVRVQTSLYSLPLLHRSRNLTTLEREFRSMLEEFANFTEGCGLSDVQVR